MLAIIARQIFLSEHADDERPINNSGDDGRGLGEMRPCGTFRSTWALSVRRRHAPKRKSDVLIITSMVRQLCPIIIVNM